MVKRVRQAKKRGPGRPATGQGLQVQVRLPPDELADLDDWIERDGSLLTRPQAIRRLVASAIRQQTRNR